MDDKIDPRFIQLLSMSKVTIEEIFQDLYAHGRTKDILELGGAIWLQEREDAKTATRVSTDRTNP